MAYARGLPLLVIVDAALKGEGLLEQKYDWYVQRVRLEESALNSPEFNGVLADWKRKMAQSQAQAHAGLPAAPLIHASEAVSAVDTDRRRLGRPTAPIRILFSQQIRSTPSHYGSMRNARH